MGGLKWCFADFTADAAFHQTLPLALFPVGLRNVHVVAGG